MQVGARCHGAQPVEDRARPERRDQIQGQAQQIFNALFVRPEVQDVSVTTEFSFASAGQLRPQGHRQRHHQDPVLESDRPLAGQLQRKSEVLWGIKKLNLALALDNTGSMALERQDDGAQDRRAQSASTRSRPPRNKPGDIKVSIVPFAVDVNAGTSKVDASPGSTGQTGTTPTATCSKTRIIPRATATTMAAPGRRRTHSVWNGCVNDRDQNNDVTNTPTGTGASTKYRAHQASACPAAMMALSTDWTDDAHQDRRHDAEPATPMSRSACRWPGRRLSNNEPFNAPAPAPDLDKVIILLTDGREHAEPLVLEHVSDRRPHAEGLRQRQGRQHQALYGARDRRQRDAAEELRDQAGHVLRRRSGERTQRRVLLDRAESRQPSHREMSNGAPRTCGAL